MGVRRRHDRGRRDGQAPWLVTFRRAGARFSYTLDGGLTEAQARDEEARLRLEARAAASARGRDRGPTVDQLVTRYWNEHGHRLRSAATERSALELWSRLLGSTPAIDVNRDRLTALVAAMRAERVGQRGRKLLSAGAINRRVQVLKRLWNRASELWGVDLPRIPWGRLRLDEPLPVDRSLSREERGRLLDAWPARSQALATLAMVTGVRAGPLLRLEVEQLDWRRGIIRLVSKGRGLGKPTPIPITEPVLGVFAAIGRLPEVGRVFHVSKDQLRKDRERARLLAGLPAFRLHDARHSFAQDLEDAGLGDVIPDALHHASPALRRRYAQASLERTAAAIEQAAKLRR
jgi:integrase